MSLTPSHTEPSFDGVVQFAREPEWSQAVFSTWVGEGSPDGSTGAELVVRREGVPEVRIRLADVTSLDEVIAEYPGVQHVEIAVDREPTLQAVWPVAFTPVLLAALSRTVDDEAPHFEPDPEVGPDPAAAPQVEPNAVAEPVTASRRASSRAGSGLIAGLALAGCVAIVVGIMGLRDATPEEPVTPGSTTVVTVSTTAPPEECAPDSDVSTTGTPTTACVTR